MNLTNIHNILIVNNILNSYFIFLLVNEFSGVKIIDYVIVYV